mmetsp:Transcript_87074/g.202701  ORF Transcript_87074/g.202701 Transcript_87074/m.202701 type:complete len:278 (-) Transcript_87074:100-933(-)
MEVAETPAAGMGAVVGPGPESAAAAALCIHATVGSKCSPTTVVGSACIPLTSMPPLMAWAAKAGPPETDINVPAPCTPAAGASTATDGSAAAAVAAGRPTCPSKVWSCCGNCCCCCCCTQWEANSALQAAEGCVVAASLVDTAPPPESAPAPAPAAAASAITGATASPAASPADGLPAGPAAGAAAGTTAASAPTPPEAIPQPATSPALVDACSLPPLPDPAIAVLAATAVLASSARSLVAASCEPLVSAEPLCAGSPASRVAPGGSSHVTSWVPTL